jgi:hypothetical protein
MRIANRWTMIAIGVLAAPACATHDSACPSGRFGRVVIIDRGDVVGNSVVVVAQTPENNLAELPPVRAEERIPTVGELVCLPN